MKQDWEKVEFENCLEKVVYTNKIQRKDFLENGEYPIISQEQDFINGYWDNSDDLFKIKKPVVIFGDHTQVLKYVDFDFALGADGVKILQPKTNIDSRFFYYYLQSITLGSLGYARHYRLLKEIYVSYPKSLPEQQRIVALLDEAFAAIAKAKANAQQNLQNAKELFESYLQGVFENKGKISELGLKRLKDERINKEHKKEILQSSNPKNHNSDNGEGWEEKSLKELTSKIGSGSTPRGGQESYKAEGISLVRSMNVHDRKFRDRNLAFIDEKQAKELNGVTLQENDVLLNITGASVARCCVFPKEYLPARVNQHVSIIRPKMDIIDPAFLNLLLTSKFYKDQLLFTGGQGATRQAITKAQLEVFRILFPPLKTQQTIVQKLDALNAETKKLESIYQQKINDLEELKKSMLERAFSGGLN